MAAEWIGNVISGAAGLLGSGINYFAQQQANETNVQLARENRDFYYQQWQRENAYNDPVAQMARLSRAGLNPALMYGEGTGGLAASATMQNVDPGRVAAPTVDPYLMAQIGLMSAQTKKTEAETDKAYSDIDVNRGIIKVNESTVMYNNALTNFTKAQQDKVIEETRKLGVEMDALNSEIAKNYATIQNMSAMQYFRAVELTLQSKELDGKLELWAAQTGMTKEQLKYVAIQAMAKVRNLNADTNLKNAQVNSVNAETLLRLAQVDLTDTQRIKCEKEIEGLEFKNGQMEWDLNMHKKYGDTMMQLNQAKIVAEMVNWMFGQTEQSAANSVLKIDTFNKYNRDHSIGFE